MYQEITVQYRDIVDPSMEQYQSPILQHLHVLFWNEVLFCNTDLPRIQNVAQAHLKFMPTLPHPTSSPHLSLWSAGITAMSYHTWVRSLLSTGGNRE